MCLTVARGPWTRLGRAPTSSTIECSWYRVTLGVYCSMPKARHCKVCCLASGARAAVDTLADCCGIQACGLGGGKYRLIQSDMRSLALRGGYKRESDQQGFGGARPAALDDEDRSEEHTYE